VLAIRTRVVVVATPLIPVVVVVVVAVATHIVLALAANGVVLGVCLCLLRRPMR
jgi:hypothetical protein